MNRGLVRYAGECTSHQEKTSERVSEECTRERRRIYALKLNGEGVYKARKREYMRRRRERNSEAYKPKPDTIVAIGYAERQRAETLQMVGRVKVEL